MEKKKLIIPLILMLILLAQAGSAMAVKSGDQHSVALSASDSTGRGSEVPSHVPEAATILLFGAGLLGICAIFKRGLLVTNGLQHTLNPLHVYCRLRDMGIGKGIAISFCIFYEKAIFKLLVGFRQ